jgi:two-component system sensor histidine kinase DegS
VALEQRDGLLCLTVADDGGGFDLEEVHARDATNRGFGLGSMRERVELSEGTFELQAEPGKGVTVHANWRMSDPVNES